MKNSYELTIGVATAVAVLLANIVEPWVSAVMAVGALLWLLSRKGKAEVRQALGVAMVAFIAAALVVFLFQ